MSSPKPGKVASEEPGPVDFFSASRFTVAGLQSRIFRNGTHAGHPCAQTLSQRELRGCANPTACNRLRDTTPDLAPPLKAPDPVTPTVPSNIIPVATHKESPPRLLAGAGFRATPIDLLVESSGLHQQIQMPQTQSTDDSITASAIGKVTVTPDEARIIVFHEEDYGP